MSVLMNVVSIWRSRSVLAWASSSFRKRAGSILLGAVIAFFSWVSVEGHPEDHAVAASTFRARYSPGAVVHHLGGRDCRGGFLTRDSHPVEGSARRCWSGLQRVVGNFDRGSSAQAPARRHSTYAAECVSPARMPLK